MSRELKFRVWEEREKTYNTWSYILDTIGNLFRDVFGTLICCDEKDYILEQYTGLKDRNGKEIYEGDIVRLYGRFISAISWQDGYCGFRWYNNSGDGYCSLSKDNEEYYEVVGNIHENKELLGGEE